MTQEGVSQNDIKDIITRRAYFFVALWAAGILLLYAIGGYLGVRSLLSSVFHEFGDVFSGMGLKTSSTEKSPLTPLLPKGGYCLPPFRKGRWGGISEAILNGIVFMKWTTKLQDRMG
jgi:hypothetical protein